MGEEIRIEEVGMREMEEIERAMAVQVMKEKVYPPRLHSHEDVANDKALFMNSLRRFHSSMGTKFSIPVLGGKEIDLHLLYKEVTQRGGLDKVILEKRWRDVIAAFGFPPTTTSASYVLRKYYLSLLHHYEQVYFFGAQGAPIPPSASSLTKTPKIKVERTLVSSESTTKKTGRRKRSEHPQQSKESCCFTVTGSIVRKFEYGYLVTVQIGPETLHGVLYHVKQPGEASPSTHVLPPLNAAAANGTLTEDRRRKKRKRRGSDPARPKPSRSAYNFYFAEQHSKLKALYPQREKEYSKMIGETWSRLTEEERLVYQARRDEDKERYIREMEEYREKQKLQQQSKEVKEAEPSNVN
ncbi:high mobility group B protein 9 [Phoenix dactylifera]|uniref:High mobility group B protein 9 n=1 Tax=Phoenix dactylifera TaxID=42345 RepID=A0A8B7BLX2_PHODC|nr:high mobility group B protein 9 [Phoenix dactylifera]